MKNSNEGKPMLVIYTTDDVCKMFHLGKVKCLELFRRADFTAQIKEGVDYTIHEYKRKKKRTSNKAICPICSQCKNRRICLNRKSKETMDRCSKCKNCKDAENCDKFYIYNEYRAEILRLGTNPNNRKPIRQQLTISAYNFALKPIQYVTRGEIERFLECEREKYKEDKDVRAFTIFEQYQFIAYVQSHPSKYNNILLLSLFTGMRIGEVLALKLQDIDIDLTSISINQTMTKDKYDKIMIGNTTKTKRGKRKIIFRRTDE